MSELTNESEELYRHLRDNTDFDKGRPAAERFRPREYRDEDGVSVDRRAHFSCRDCVSEAAENRNMTSDKMAILTVGECNSVKLPCLHAPANKNRAHSKIDFSHVQNISKRKEKAQKLRELAEERGLYS